MPRRFIAGSIVWCTLAVTAAIGFGVAADTGSDTAIQRAVSHEGRSDADLARDATSKPAKVLTFFGLKPGMVVIDLFGGGGYYSELALYVVGQEGKVILHNNQPYLSFVGEELEKRFANDRLSGIDRIVTETDDLGLQKGTADMILMIMSYHDLYFVDEESWPEIDRKKFWEQVLSALKPGGTLGVVDHVAVAGTGSNEVQKLHRIDKEFAKSDIEAAGFVFEAESDVLRNPDDDHTLSVFDPKIRRKTDRFVYRFRRPE